MSQGLSLESFAATIEVNRDTIYEWAKVHPEFSDTIKRATELSLLFWERIGLTGMAGKIRGFNAAVWIFNMKNRFKWNDGLGAADANKENEYEAVLNQAIAKLNKQKP